MNDNFESVGFEAIYFLHNLGTMFFIMAYFPILMFANWIARKLRKYQSVRKWVRENDETLYWSGTLRMVMESYTIVAVCAFINLTDLTWNSYGDIVISVSAIVSLVFCAGFPFWVTIKLYNNFEKIQNEDEEFTEKFEALWEGLKIDERATKSVLWYQFWFFFRRFLLGVLVV
jgi:hypothetical protein